MSFMLEGKASLVVAITSSMVSFLQHLEQGLDNAENLFAIDSRHWIKPNRHACGAIGRDQEKLHYMSGHFIIHFPLICCLRVFLDNRSAHSPDELLGGWIPNQSKPNFDLIPSNNDFAR